MTRQKYRYNPDTLSFEPRHEPPLRRLMRGALVFLISASAGLGLMFMYTTFFDTPRSHALQRAHADNLIELQLLQDQVNSSMRQMAIIEQRDNNLYRTIFEADSIPSSVRLGGVGGSERYREYNDVDQSEELRSLALDLDRLSWRAYIQSKSFDDVIAMAHKKERMMHCVPAVQPVSVSQLVRISSTFGVRIDPFTKMPRMHSGVDFVGAPNTPIHCTGDGLVVTASANNSGYGLQVIVDHGFGYKTRYAHLNSTTVREGDRVKRGQVVGKMGSTGRSTSTHLHYEVLHRNVPVNPLLYFNDMSEEEYEDMLSRALMQDLD